MIKPEVKTVGTGKTVATFGLVVKTAQEDKDDMWIDVNAWETLGKNVVDSFPTDRKTMRVTVTGKLRKDSWEDIKTGQTKTRFFIVADNVAPTLDYQTVGNTAYAGDNGVKQTQTSGHFQAQQRSAMPEPQARTDYGEDEAPF